MSKRPSDQEVSIAQIITHIATIDDSDQSLMDMIGSYTSDQISVGIAYATCDDYSRAFDIANIENKALVDDEEFAKGVFHIAALLKSERVKFAREFLKTAIAEAVAVKISGLRSSNEKIQQRAATEIINWGLGKAATTRATADKVMKTQYIKKGFHPDSYPDNEEELQQLLQAQEQVLVEASSADNDE